MAQIPQTYTVVPGDSLSLISKKMYGDFSMTGELATVNKIANANLIYPGQQLVIPPAKSGSALQVTSSSSNTSTSSSSHTETNTTKKTIGKFLGWGFVGLAALLLAYEANKQHKKNKASKAKPKAAA